MKKAELRKLLKNRENWLDTYKYYEKKYLAFTKEDDTPTEKPKRTRKPKGDK